MKRQWEKDLKYKMSQEEWLKFMVFNSKFSLNVGIKENRFKILQRWHLMPVRIAKTMSPSANDLCWKCGEQPGTFMHMWWFCPTVQRFWLQVRRILKCTFPFVPRIMLICNFKLASLGKYSEIAANLFTAAAKWKDKVHPSEAEWVSKI